MKRRRFLTVAGLAALSPTIGWTMGRSSRVGIAVLDHESSPKNRPRAVEQLMWEVSKRTSINVREAPVFVQASSPRLFDHPLLVWMGSRPGPAFTEEERAQLRRYLRSGGTLFIDDVSPPGDDRFDAYVRLEMEAVWPEETWTTFDNDHTIYRAFYLLPKPSGRIRRQAFLEGIQFDDRSPVIYGRNDLFGALSRESLGGWTYPVVPGGHTQRERALRLGINLIMYATCLNYKRDQVHVTAILRRRR